MEGPPEPSSPDSLNHRPVAPSMPPWLQQHMNGSSGVFERSPISQTKTPATSPLRSTSSPRHGSFAGPLNYYGTPPSPLRTDRKRPADGTPVRPTAMKMLASDDDLTERDAHRLSILTFIERECEKNHWIGKQGQGRPTSDPFKLLALCSVENPWHTRNLHLSSPQQLSASLENVYSNTNAICQALKFQPHSGDLMVCGVYRSGVTPALQVLASLKEGKVVPKLDMLDKCDWLEAAHPSHNPTFERHHAGNRLIRTHMPLRTLFGGVVTPCPRGSRPEFHVVVMLRDPADVRLSWYRHLRRVYRKFNPNDHNNFDAHFNVDDFASVQLYATNPNISSAIVNHCDYENFVLEAVKSTVEEGNTQVLLCFYEELLMNPKAFVQKIADFIGKNDANEDLIDEIAQSLVADEDFPSSFTPPASPIATQARTEVGGGMPRGGSLTSLHAHRHHRRGCAGQGRLVFSKDSLRKFEFKWRDIVSHAGNGCSSYEKLVFAVSPIFRDLMQHGSVSSSSSGGVVATARLRAGSMASLITPKGLSRLGFFSFFHLATSKNQDAPSSEHTESEGDAQTEEDSEASHVLALFGELPSSTDSKTTTTRSRTSSLMSFGSFRGKVQHTGLAPSGRGSLVQETGTPFYHHKGQEVDPDDSGDEEELNIFLDMKKSRIYGERRTRGDSAVPL